MATCGAGVTDALGADVLVNVHSSKLVVALPLMEYALRGGQRHLPLNVIVYLPGRLGWVEDSRLALDLVRAVRRSRRLRGRSRLDRFVAFAFAHGA